MNGWGKAALTVAAVTAVAALLLFAGWASTWTDYPWEH